MAPSETSRQTLLERERQAWRDLHPCEYDRVLCQMLETVSNLQDSAAIVSLASIALRRNAPGLIDSRACIAERLLTVLSGSVTPHLEARVCLLFLLAWLRLGAEVAAGPDHISAVPDLPAGVALPSGADPEAIADPVLREKAYELAKLHAEEVVRWNAKQRAADHLDRLAARVRACKQELRTDRSSISELEAVMSASSGLTPALRSLLEESART